MANAQNSNSFYIDSTGSLTTIKNQRVCSITFTAAAADDTIVLKDTDTSGALKIKVQAATAKQTFQIPFDPPIVFPGGIYVSTITAGAIATIVTGAPN